jgi:hypothetical protein
MESDLGVDEQPSAVPSLEEELVQQFGPNVMTVDNSIIDGEGTEEVDDEASEEVDMTEFIDDSAPMDLTAGSHHISSDSDDDEEEPEENPLRALIKQNKVCL